MRLSLLRSESTGLLLATVLEPLCGEAEGVQAMHLLRPGEWWGPYSYEALWGLGNGTHELEEAPLGADPTSTRPG